MIRYALTIFLRLSAVSGPTAGWQIHSALVRRHAQRLDDVYALVPGAVVIWLCVCACRGRLVVPATTGHCAPGSVGGLVGLPADYAQRELEAHGERSPRMANPGLAGHDDRSAVFRPLVDDAAGAKLVQPRGSGPLALSAVRIVERRFAVGPVELPVCGRACLVAGHADLGLVAGLSRLRGAVRLVRLRLNARARPAC